MRYLLVLLFTINTSFAICRTDTIASVNKCTVNDKIYQLINKVRPEAVHVTKEEFIEDSLGKYYFEIDETKTLYENLIIDPVLPLADLQDALSLWVVMWVDKLQLRLDKKAYRNRLNVFKIETLFPSILRGTGRGHDLFRYMKQLTESLDYPKLEAIEAAAIVVKQEQADKETARLADITKKEQLKALYNKFRTGTATNTQVQKAIAYILKRL